MKTIVISSADDAASAAALRQSERDATDNKAVQDAWISFVGGLPDFAEQRIARGEVFYSALDLAENLIGPCLAGWRISFTSDGGPYSATLILSGAKAGTPSEIEASHPTSLALAFIAVIEKWTANRPN